MTPDPERWKIGDRRLHGQPRGWFPGPWWLVDLDADAEEREDDGEDVTEALGESGGGAQAE